MTTDNEIIAEFMGATPCEIQVKSIGIVNGYECEQFKLPIDEMEYHESWDWLMPVVEKIENIKHIGIDAVYFNIKGRQAQIWTYFDVKEFLRLTGDDKNESNKFKVGISGKTKIEATYAAVVEFIKWYNKSGVVSKE